MVVQHQDVPSPYLSVYQISRQSDNAFMFYNNFHTLMKRKRKKEETQPIFKGSYIGNTLVEIWNMR